MALMLMPAQVAQAIRYPAKMAIGRAFDISMMMFRVQFDVVSLNLEFETRQGRMIVRLSLSFPF